VTTPLLPPFLTALTTPAPCHGRHDLYAPAERSAKPEADRVLDARPLCARCPVYAACLDWAVTTGESGIWAGTTGQQRAALGRKRTHKPRVLEEPVLEEARSGCGTEPQFRRHRLAREPCDVCEIAHAERVRADRVARLAVSHGTPRGYELHRLLGVLLCEGCRGAVRLRSARARAVRAPERLPDARATVGASEALRGPEIVSGAAA
jgi:Transcription factor WhiB